MQPSVLLLSCKQAYDYQPWIKFRLILCNGSREAAEPFHDLPVDLVAIGERIDDHHGRLSPYRFDCNGDAAARAYVHAARADCANRSPAPVFFESLLEPVA